MTYYRFPLKIIFTMSTNVLLLSEPGSEIQIWNTEEIKYCNQHLGPLKNNIIGA
jgi:hypothetical protein